MQTYDLAIPLGLNCSAAAQLRQRNLRLASFPFDWLSTYDHADPLDLPLKSMENHFSEWLKHENLDGERYASFGKQDLHFPVYDSGSGYLFLHDFTSPHPTAEETEQVRAKYSRRIERMYKMIEEAQRILFVVSARENQLSMEKLRQTYGRLKELFPSKTLALVAFTQEAPEDRTESELDANNDGIYFHHTTTVLQDIIFHKLDWSGRILDYFRLSGMFPQGGKEGSQDSAGLNVSPMSFMEKLHWKAFKHCRRYLVKRNRIPSYFK